MLTYICFQVVEDDTYKLVRYSSFFFSLIVDIFLQCIMGQVLIDHVSILILSFDFDVFNDVII